MVDIKKKNNSRFKIVWSILFILVLFSFITIILTSTVSAPSSRPINRFFTTQELNRTQTPPMEVSGYPAADISSGMVGYWKCDGDFTDGSGMGNDGTQTGGVSITRGVKG